MGLEGKDLGRPERGVGEMRLDITREKPRSSGQANL